MHAAGLKSGVSAMAVMAAVSAPALAGEIIGPGQAPAIVNHDTTDFYIVVPQTTIGARGRQSFVNTGTIAGSGASVTIAGAHLTGGLSNTGVIDSASIGINLIAGTTLQGTQIWTTIDGSVTNTGSINGDWTGVNTFFTSIDGSFTNRGSISGELAAVNSFLTTVDKGVINDRNGVMRSTDARGRTLQLFLSKIDGGIVNRGTIIAEGDSAIAVNAANVALTGGFTNTGVISAPGIFGYGVGISFGVATPGLFVSDGTMKGDIVNDGTIVAGAGAIGISGGEGFGGGKVIGNFINNGLLEVELGHAVYMTNLAGFDGDVINNGTIHSHSAAGILLNGTNINGDIVNAKSGSIIADAYHGIFSIETVMHADVTNYGQITAGGTGMYLWGVQATETDVPTMFGSIKNEGDICGLGGGIYLQTSKMFGSITNAGNIRCANSGVGIFAMSDISGDVTNTGAITANAGIVEIGTIGGALINSGIIKATGEALGVQGYVAGGIRNSGTLSGSVGINLTGATAGNTITETAGLIEATGASGSSFALYTANNFADTFIGKGGKLAGDVIVDDQDRFDFAPSASFAWTRGSTYGTLADASKTGDGTLFLGASARGDQSGGPVSLNTAQMALNGGRLYLDDQAAINVAGAYKQSPDTTLEFFLTSDTATHGQIAAQSVNLGGTIAAYIDPLTLAAAAVPIGSTFMYDDVLIGARTGTFSNGTNLVTSSPFFRGTVIYNANDVDIRLTRLPFAQAVQNATLNQKAVGNAFDNLSQMGGLSNSMSGLVAAVFAGHWNFDELSGAQFAQLQTATQGLAGTINAMIGEHLNGVSFAPAATFDPETVVSLTSPTTTDAPSASGATIWMRSLGEDTAAPASALAPGFAQQARGLVTGFDIPLTDALKVGAAYAHAQSDIGFTTKGDSARIDTWQMDAYGAYRAGRFFGDARASYGRHDVAAGRVIDLPLIGSTRTAANYDATTWSLTGEFGATWQAGPVALKPALALAYVGTTVDPFIETGSSYALRVDGSDMGSLASTLALETSARWTLSESQLSSSLKLGWRHEFADRGQTLTASFVESFGADTAMHIVSPETERDSLVLSAAIAIGRDTETFLGVSGRYDANVSTTDASVGIRFTW